jgi:AcrR family transcriptional regulator
MALDDDPKRCRLLEAALSVFVRFGFRKTSMDEVARAANVSRQGLYLHYPAKEDLFRAAVEHALKTSLEAATARLAADAPLEERLCGAFDEWVGRYVGAFGPGATDLVEAKDALVGPMWNEHERMFLEAVTKAVRSSGLVSAYKPTGLSARQLAETLSATARGLKTLSATRAEFAERMAVAARALCAPLATAS